MLDNNSARRRRDEKPGTSDLLPTSFMRAAVRAGRKPRRWTLVALAAVLCLVYYYYFSSSNGGHTSDDSDVVSGDKIRPGSAFGGKVGGLAGGGGGQGLSQGGHKITVIAIWVDRGGEPPTYLPYFFQSVEANPEVDLLFINVDKEQKDCASYSSAPNVQEVCLTEKQYHELHVDYLCRRWHCASEDRKIIYNIIKQKSPDDNNNSFFRILRNGIFARWMDPRTTIWGWCDADTFWGNFSRTFPWEIADKYDVLAVAGQPAFGDQRLLFTRGHMAFFKNTPEVTERLLSFPKFSSMSSYLTLPATRNDAEESEFSHYLFTDEEEFTFITFEGMVDSYDSVFLSSQGSVFYTQLKKEDMSVSSRQRFAKMILQPKRREPGSIFSDEGIEKKTRLFLDGRYYEGGLWFPAEHATFVETGWSVFEREQKAYFMRHRPGGPVMQRMEPRARYLYRDGSLHLDESLYKHWQAEKHNAWFHRIPPQGIQEGHIFVQYHGDEAEIWDPTGQVVFETGKN